MTYGILSVLAERKLDRNHNNILMVYGEISSRIPTLQCDEAPGDLIRSLRLSLTSIEDVLTMPEETYHAEQDRIYRECTERRDTLYSRYTNYYRKKHVS